MHERLGAMEDRIAKLEQGARCYCEWEKLTLIRGTPNIMLKSGYLEHKLAQL
jgi:hypothetical protein